MKISMFRRFMPLIALMLCAATLVVHAEAPAPDAAAVDDARPHHARHGHHGNDRVSIGHDSTLGQGEQADSVVSILGSSTSDGEAQTVVSVLGNTRVTGPLGESAVSILGNTYIDAKVGGDAVAVLGNVELGPNAEIDGDVVSVGGQVLRDPAAVIHGDVQNVIAGNFGAPVWLHTWIQHCLLYGRPLAFAPGLGWAWSLALAFLALYVCIALLFRSGVTQCVRTFETHPGRSILAAFITMLLAPVLVVLLCITVIGIVAVPFVVFGFFCAGLFGKAVMLTWVGTRLVGEREEGALSHPAAAVLIGGLLVLLLYVVPVLGFVIYKLLGFLGLGVVVFALISATRAQQAAKRESTGPAAAPAAPPAAPAAPHVVDTAAPAPGPTTAPAAAAAVSAALPHAGFWIRMGALLLDVLVVGIVMSVLHGVSHLHLIILAAYGAVMWKLRGSTIGGIVFDLRVVRLDGRELDWATAIVRALGCFLSLAVAGLGFFWIAFDDAHQAWHDKIAGTVVVRVPKGVPLV
jgi:uncharacterized RDD family membrane protein YckC